MTKNLFFSLGLLLILAVFALVAAPVAASPQPQVFYQTPTPDAEGRIVYVVREGENCMSISLLTSTDLNDLRVNNDLDEACNIFPGQKLVLKVVEPQTPMPTAEPTPSSSEPTPTPFAGNARVCIYLYNDINGNALSEDGEDQIAGGAVSITDRSGQVSLTNTTTGGETPVCFDEVPEGAYNVSVAPPSGYNPTTLMNYALELRPGDSSTLDFGAQVGSVAPVEAVVEPTSPMLGIFGILLVLGGAGLGLYVWLSRR